MLSKIVPIILGANFGIFVLLAANVSLKTMILIFSALAIFFASIIVRNKKKLLLTLMIIDTGLNISVHFFRDPNVLATREGIQISITTITLGILYLLWWNDIITKRAMRVEYFPKITVIGIGYIIACLLSIYNSQNVLMSIFDLFIITQMIMLYFYVANYITSKEDIIYILYILVVCLFIQSIIIFIQYATKTHFTLTGNTSSIEVLTHIHGGRSVDVYRPAGTSSSPNETGGHIAMLLLMVLSLLLYTNNRFKNTLVGIVLLMGVAALSLTFSRGSWAGCAVGLVVFLVVALRHRWMSWKKVVATAVLIAVILGVFSGPIAARLSQDDRGAALSRVPLMKLAFNMIQEHPLIGIGANNFGIALPSYLSSELRGEWLYIVHNQYMLVFAETGAIGLLFFLLIIAIAIRTCLRCIKHKDPLVSSFLTGTLSGIVCLLIFMTVELSVSRLTVQLFWIMISIIVGSERLVRINRQQFLNLSMPTKVASLTYERRSFAHESG